MSYARAIAGRSGHTVTMTRLTVSLPDDVSVALKFEARRRGTSASSLVVEALERHLGRNMAGGRTLPFESLGLAADDRLSERFDEILAAEWHR